MFVLARKVKVQVSFALLPHTANPAMLYYPLERPPTVVLNFSPFLDLFPFWLSDVPELPEEVEAVVCDAGDLAEGEIDEDTTLDFVIKLDN